MTHRTQITLTDEQYELLLEESHRTGVALAELVRRAVDRTYRKRSPEDVIRALDASFGLWRDHGDEDGEAYVERMRPGMAARLKHIDEGR
jgi:hypothetical protein